MKHTITTLICLFLAGFAIATDPTAGQHFIQNRKSSGNGFEANSWTWTVGTLLGRYSGGAVGPVTIGTNLTLTAGGILNATGGGATTFAALTDVNLTTLASGDMLKWDGTDWINRTAANVRSDLGLVIGTNIQAWGAKLDTISALANGAGVLTNDGSGAFSYTAFASILAPASDEIARYAANGALGVGSGGLYIGGDGAGNGTLDLIDGATTFIRHNNADNTFSSSLVFPAAAAITSNFSIAIPAASGTMAVSASGNVAVSAAGNITFTGTLPVANGGTGITSLGANVATLLGTFNMANLDAAISDGNAAYVGAANTFTAAQTITQGAITASAPNALTQEWNNAAVEFKSLVVSAIQTAYSTTIDSESKIQEWRGGAAGTTTKAYVDYNGGFVGTAYSVYGSPSSGGGFVGIKSPGDAGIACYSGGNPIGVFNWFDGVSSNMNFSVRGDGKIGFLPSTTFAYTAPDVFWMRDAAATMQIGADVDADATDQTIKAADGITGTDRAGADLTLSSGNATGSGESAVIIKTTSAGASGTTTRTAAERIRVSGNGEIFLNLPTAAGTTGSLWNDAGTVKVAP